MGTRRKRISNLLLFLLTVSPKEATTTSKQRGDYEYMYIQVDLDNLIYPIAKALESTKQVTRG